MSWNVGGVQRQALVYAPSVRTPRPPLVLAFHGHGGTMKSASTHMDIHAFWPEAVVVYPQGLPTQSGVDPQGRRPGWQHEPGEPGHRDLRFVTSIWTPLLHRYSVN